MISLILKALFVMSISLFSFWCGINFKEKHLMGTADKYVLKQSIDLSGDNGTVPKGTLLYDAYDNKLSQYYVFINVSGEALPMLEKYQGDDFNLISPLNAGLNGFGDDNINPANRP